MRACLLLLLALVAGGPAVAQARAVGTRLFVESPSAGGVRLAPAPNRLARGRSVVVLVGLGGLGVSPSAVVSAVPATLRFVRADGGAELSVDGGRHFGPARAARPAAVTHVRWRIAPGARAPALSFRGTVR